jgi:hypothetical protein
MLVMLLLLLLLSLQGTGWLLLAMAGRTAENRIPASVAATMLLGRLKADRQWWMAVAVRAMNVRLIISINDLSFIPICRMP